LASGVAGVGTAIPSSASFFSAIPAMMFSLSMWLGRGSVSPIGGVHATHEHHIDSTISTELG
jgi:hypothetical protein